MPEYTNHFSSPTYKEETILDKEERTIGTIRIKPSGILWKPVNASKFYRVSLDTFIAWITDPETGATRTTS